VHHLIGTQLMSLCTHRACDLTIGGWLY